MSASKVKTTKDKARMVKTGRGGLQGIQPASSFDPDQYHRREDVMTTPHGRELNPSTKDTDKLHFSRVGRGGNGNLQRYFVQPGLFERVTTYEMGRVQARKDDQVFVDKTSGRGNMQSGEVIRRPSVASTDSYFSSISRQSSTSSTSQLSIHRPSNSITTLVEPSITRTTTTTSSHHRSTSSSTLFDVDDSPVSFFDSPEETATTPFSKLSFPKPRSLLKRFLNRESSSSSSSKGKVQRTASWKRSGERGEELRMVPTPYETTFSISSDLSSIADSLDRFVFPAPDPSQQQQQQQQQEEEKKRRPRPVGMILNKVDLVYPNLPHIVAVDSPLPIPHSPHSPSHTPQPTAESDPRLSRTSHLSPPPYAQLDPSPTQPVPSPLVDRRSNDPRPPSPPLSAMLSSVSRGVWDSIYASPPDSSCQFVFKTRASSLFLPVSAPTSPNPLGSSDFFSPQPSAHSASFPSYSRPSPPYSGPDTSTAGVRRLKRSASVPGIYQRQRLRSASTSRRTSSHYSPSHSVISLSLTEDLDMDLSASPLQSAVILMEGYYTPSPPEVSPRFYPSAAQALAELDKRPPPRLSMPEDWLSTPFACRFSRGPSATTATARHRYEGDEPEEEESSVEVRPESGAVGLMNEVDDILRELFLRRLTFRDTSPVDGNCQWGGVPYTPHSDDDDTDEDSRWCLTRPRTDSFTLE